MRASRLTDRRRRSRKGDRMRVVVVMVLLLLLEFYLRPALVEIHHGAPDFMMLVLLLLAIRRSPGVAAVIGLTIGLVIDVLTPAHFGAGILASVLVGWGAAWGRSLFFADNLMVNAALFFIGTWVRDVLLLVFSGTSLKALPTEALVWAPLQSLSTAVVGVAVVIVFREWLAIRIEA
ncbi:MAG TPA: rod shape-determining protein MreD [Gemmatimonadales bacterium]|jgi:rod shape-determining protein MreD